MIPSIAENDVHVKVLLKQILFSIYCPLNNEQYILLRLENWSTKIIIYGSIESVKTTSI